MADISKIKIESSTYDIKDSTARDYNIYSSTEKIIGKWIDGRNIYRKVVTYNNTSTIGATGVVTNITISESTPSIELLIDCKLVKGGYNFPTLSGGANVERSTSVTQVTNTSINLRIINDTWGAATWYIIIDYVKSS